MKKEHPVYFSQWDFESFYCCIQYSTEFHEFLFASKLLTAGGGNSPCLCFKLSHSSILLQAKVVFSNCPVQQFDNTIKNRWSSKLSTGPPEKKLSTSPQIGWCLQVLAKYQTTLQQSFSPLASLSSPIPWSSPPPSLPSWQVHLGNTASPGDHVPLLPRLGAHDPKLTARTVIWILNLIIPCYCPPLTALLLKINVSFQKK